MAVENRTNGLILTPILHRLICLFYSGDFWITLLRSNLPNNTSSTIPVNPVTITMTSTEWSGKTKHCNYCSNRKVSLCSPEREDFFLPGVVQPEKPANTKGHKN